MGYLPIDLASYCQITEETTRNLQSLHVRLLLHPRSQLPQSDSHAILVAVAVAVVVVFAFVVAVAVD